MPKLSGTFPSVSPLPPSFVQPASPSLERIHCPLILGGGPAGASAALFLAQQGIPSVVLERARFPRDKICGDAFSGKVVNELKRLNLAWPADTLQQVQALPSWGIRFFAPNRKALDLPFALDYDPATQTAPGFIATRLAFDNWLAEQAKTNPLVEFREQQRVRKLAVSPRGVQLELHSGAQLEAPVVLAADGANGVGAKQLAGHRLQRRHHCAAVRWYWQDVNACLSDGFIELHFQQEVLPGYFWIFPMQDGRVNVGLGMRSDVLSKRKVNLKKRIQHIVENHPQIAPRFKGATPLEAPVGFGLPVGSRRRPLSGPRYLLLGDAGGLIDPFTGEGISNAMISARHAAAVVAEHWAAIAAGLVPVQSEWADYDRRVYRRLGRELQMSTVLQRLSRYPGLFNLVVNKANRSTELRNTLSSMFAEVDLRKQFRNPLFYLRVLAA